MATNVYVYDVVLAKLKFSPLHHGIYIALLAVGFYASTLYFN
jgi:hypothetical protein